MSARPLWYFGVQVKTAFIFPGQGSQYVGMGLDLAAAYPEARAVFEQADAVLGFALSRLCAEGPDDVLTDTINAQPALLTHSIAVLTVLKSHGHYGAPAFTAGHSLGEYSALVAAEAIDFAPAVKLVRERGRAMKSAAERAPGAMAAFIGIAETELEAICHETGAQIANYNAPGQIVLSGSKEDMSRAIEMAKARGAKRVVPLAVSIASHSRWMEPAARAFAEAVKETPLRPPRVPVISNVTARPLQSEDEIRHELVAQLTSSVQWIKSVEFMIGQGVTRFLELGPKDVTAGLVRRINRDVHAVSIGDMAGIKAFVESREGGA